jgi:nucleoside 2-deoxyribosyltransferase
MSKLYVAASFEQKEKALQLYDILKAKGHIITADWTTHKEIASLPTFKERETLAKQYAIEDTNGITSADVFILLLSERKSTGTHIELGVALGSTNVKQIFLVSNDNDSQLFYRHPKVKQVKSIEELLKIL